MKKTKKLGIAATFGARYGKRIRDNYRNVMQKKTSKHKCPRCGKVKVKRVSYAIWECGGCGYKFAGGAYAPFTNLGKIAARVVNAHLRGKEAIEKVEAAGREELEQAEKEKEEDASK